VFFPDEFFLRMTLSIYVLAIAVLRSVLFFGLDNSVPGFELSIVQ